MEDWIITAGELRAMIASLKDDEPINILVQGHDPGYYHDAIEISYNPPTEENKRAEIYVLG